MCTGVPSNHPCRSGGGVCKGEGGACHAGAWWKLLDGAEKRPEMLATGPAGILLGTLGLGCYSAGDTGPAGILLGTLLRPKAVCWQLIPRPISAATDRSHAKKRAGEVGKLSSLAPVCRIAPPASSAELPIASCQRRRAAPRTVSIWEAAGA